MTPDASISQIVVTDIPAKIGGSIRFIELNRPEKLNCLSLEMLKALFAALQKSENANCVVLTGVGRSFCTGLDFKEIGGPEGATDASTFKHLYLLVSIFRWILTAKIPTAVLARGYAAGGGAALVACAQTAVVSDDFRCKLPGGNLARLASVAVPLFELRTAGKTQSDFNWFGREFDAIEAKSMGLVDRIVSQAHLNATIMTIKGGEISPELIEVKKRSEHEVENALKNLGRFLKSLTACKAG